jgi:hypothetical protein
MANLEKILFPEESASITVRGADERFATGKCGHVVETAARLGSRLTS